MSYKINNILLSDYGIKATRVQGSNIAVSGIFDLPKRIGKTFESWAEEDTIEPYVDKDEIFLGGRDIAFYGLIIGTKTSILSNIGFLTTDIAAFTDLVVFETPYGSFNVKVKKVNPIIKNGLGLIEIIFRETQPNLSGGILPAENPTEAYLIDRMSFKSFGLSVSSINGRGDQAPIEKEQYTLDNKEGVQLNGRKINDIKIQGFVKGADLSTFQANIKALWKVFTDEGLRSIMLNDYVTLESFVVNGFTVRNIKKQTGQMIGEITINIIPVEQYIKVYLTEDLGNKILTTEDAKILVYE